MRDKAYASDASSVCLGAPSASQSLPHALHAHRPPAVAVAKEVEFLTRRLRWALSKPSFRLLLQIILNPLRLFNHVSSDFSRYRPLVGSADLILDILAGGHTSKAGL